MPSSPLILTFDMGTQSARALLVDAAGSIVAKAQKRYETPYVSPQPGWAEQDADFASLRQRGDWQDEICRRFGNWLNARLTTPNTPMGAVEAAHWRDVLDEEMRLMRDEVADDE